MPSPFERQFAAQADSLYSQFSLAATYTAPDGSTTSGITIIVHRNDAHQVDRNVKASGELQTGEIRVRQSELAKAVKGGRFKVEGVEVWTVETMPVLKNGQHYCTCSRSGVERIMERRAKE